MSLIEACRLCENPHTILIFKNSKSRQFYQCQACGYIQVHSQNFVSLEAENQRYLLHNNDVESEGYQSFLKPVVDEIISRQKPEDQGLDYGSGPSSVVDYLLKKQNYSLQCYDPLFFNDPPILTLKFDYIVCTEVAEHFKNPIVEFQKIAHLMKPCGILYLKTELTDQVQDFANWYYHRDSTHVGFFNQKTLSSIEKIGHLELLHQDLNFILFKKLK